MIAHQSHLGAVHISLIAAQLLADLDRDFADQIEVTLQLADLLLDVVLIARCDFAIAALDNEFHDLVLPCRSAQTGRLLGGTAWLHWRKYAAPNARSP